MEVQLYLFLQASSLKRVQEGRQQKEVFIFRKLGLSLDNKFVGSDTTVNLFTRDWQEGR